MKNLFTKLVLSVLCSSPFIAVGQSTPILSLEEVSSNLSFADTSSFLNQLLGDLVTLPILLESSEWHAEGGASSYLEAVEAQDSKYLRSTSVASALGGQTEYLQLTGFDFNVPSDAVITGVELKMRRMVDRPSLGLLEGVLGPVLDALVGSMKDHVIMLVKDGEPMGDNMASSSAWSRDAWETETYGGLTNLWGALLTPDDVNDPDFGVVISAQYGSGLSLGVLPSFFIDHVELVVHYQENIVLPITQTDMDLRLEEEGVVFDWEVVPDDKMLYFAVERCYVSGAWEMIGLVHEMESNTGFYSFTDVDLPMENTYYRIRQVNSDGQQYYSCVMSLKMQPSDKNEIEARVYPNPAVENAFISIINPSCWRVRLLDNLGAPKEVDFTIQADGINVEVTDLPNGSYLLMLDNGVDVVQKRLVVGI